MIFLWLPVGWIANESLEGFTLRINDVCSYGAPNITLVVGVLK